MNKIKRAVIKRKNHKLSSYDSVFDGVARINVDYSGKKMIFLNQLLRAIDLTLVNCKILGECKVGDDPTCLEFQYSQSTLRAIVTLEKITGKRFYRAGENHMIHFVDIGYAKGKKISQTIIDTWDRDLLARAQ